MGAMHASSVAEAPQRVCPHCSTIARTTEARCPLLPPRATAAARPSPAFLVALVLAVAATLGGVALMLQNFGDRSTQELDEQVDVVQRDFDRDVRGLERRIEEELERRFPAPELRAGSGASARGSGAVVERVRRDAGEVGDDLRGGAGLRARVDERARGRRPRRGASRRRRRPGRRRATISPRGSTAAKWAATDGGVAADDLLVDLRQLAADRDRPRGVERRRARRATTRGGGGDSNATIVSTESNTAASVGRLARQEAHEPPAVRPAARTRRRRPAPTTGRAAPRRARPASSAARMST